VTAGLKIPGSPPTEIKLAPDRGAGEISTAQPAWVLLPGEAARRGFRNALAFRRFCKRNGVPIHRNGRLEGVCPSDVDEAMLGVPPPPSNTDVTDGYEWIAGRRHG
jgi:hypothetical protein